MPKIIINEQEEISLAAFDVTENTVLIPMLYARDYVIDSEGNVEYTEVDAPASRLFTSAKVFRSVMGSHYISVDRQGNPDKSYVMAYELLLQGLNVVIKPIAFDNAAYTDNVLGLDEVYKILENAISVEGILDEFKNRNIFNLKFITTGAYANCGTIYVETIIDEETGEEREVEVKSTMYTIIRKLASDRGDALALIEYKEYFENEEELFDAINNTSTDSYDDLYAAAFFPWCNFTTSALAQELEFTMPACFAYLMAYANSVKFNANWFAAGGVNRGLIPNLIRPNFNVGESLMHVLQGDDVEGYNSLNLCVNPIYNAGVYGYKIWGNRVFNKLDGSLADRYMNFLNVRMLLCDIKKQIYH